MISTTHKIESLAETESKVKNCLHQVLQTTLDRTDIKDDMDFTKLEVDSLTRVEIVMALEQKLKVLYKDEIKSDIEIPESYTEIRLLSDFTQKLVELVYAKLPEAESIDSDTTETLEDAATDSKAMPSENDAEA